MPVVAVRIFVVRLTAVAVLKPAVVANKFVDETDVPVAFTNESNPVEARFVAVVFWREVDPVAVRLDVVNPPKN